ncbi:Hypothetical predicted protein, partial [Pelobates cultripes]
ERTPQSGAYCTLSASQATSALLGFPDEAGLYPHKARKHTPGGDTMGQKSQKAQTSTTKDFQDIGAWLQRSATHKMAAPPEHEAGSSSSDSAYAEHGEPANPKTATTAPTDPDALTSATKLDIKSLLELKQMSAAEMDLTVPV